MILPIEFKEKILNGTMCAFVSKKIEVNVGEIVEFFEWDYPERNKSNRIFVEKFSNINNRKWIDELYFAKAECTGVIKSTFYLDGYIKGFCMDFILDDAFGFTDNGLSDVGLVKKLGFNKDKECFDYYKNVLGNTMQGYLHIFKLVKDGE